MEHVFALEHESMIGGDAAVYDIGEAGLVSSVRAGDED